MKEICTYLKGNDYPGRGILVGKKGGEMLIAYFIMGRSVNSRNRVFRKKDGILFTKAFDESKVADPSLIIYNAIRTYEGKTIVTNGDQTDTIHEFLKEGRTFEEALQTREYEPDAPNFTPRISAIVEADRYKIAILKKKGETCERLFYEYEGKDDLVHFISTYDHDGDPLPSFSKDPISFEINDDIDSFASRLWESLSSENKVSLYVGADDKEYIFNRNEGD
jgi:IMP cyclohydrolase